MRSKLLILALALLPFAASAQSSPLGKWKTFDEETGQARSIVEVYEAKDGTLSGKVVETLYAPNPLCDKCTGANKNKPVNGMTILWGLKKAGDGYSGGTVLKPSVGKTYKSKARLTDGGKKFEVSGCMAFICKKQVWTRQP